MNKYLDIAWNSLSGYWNYFWNEVSHPHFENYFYGLLALSLLVFVLELVRPWRKGQKVIRKDFWLDFFYMFFNYFFFYMIGFAALSEVSVNLFNDFLSLFGINNLIALEINTWPYFLQLLTYFLVVDFVHWNVHVLLHKIPFLWEFHKVHHSVEEMGFAAHLRFHWAENVFYKSAQYIPLALIGGFGIDQLIIVHMFQTLIGHLNHANFDIDYGPLKYIFNNPRMHIWHHAKELPGERRNGVNFGISLSIWDYIFRTDYIPKCGRDIKLGFEKIEKFPKKFWEQFVYPFIRKG